MRCLIAGDQHHHNWSAFSSVDPATGLNTRLLDQLRTLEQIAKVRDQYDCAQTFWLGDWWHSRSKLDADLVSVVTQKVYDLWAGHETTWICGNHDLVGAGDDATRNSLSMLSPLGRIISTPTRLELPGGAGCHAYPFRRNPELLKHEFARATKDWGVPDLLLLHQGIDEALVGAYNVSIKASLSVRDLPPARFTAAGHYHRPQTVSDQPTVVYAGSIMQTDMSDRLDGPRSVIILDTDTWDFTRVPLDGPQFHLYPDLASAKSGKHRECDFVRIQCRKAEVEEARALLPTAQVELVRELVQERRVIPAGAGESDKALLESYIAERKPELDHERLLKLGLELLDGSA